MEPRLKTQ